MGLLDGKNAIVTGGGQGIGRAISLAFAKEGANVAVCDMNLETATSTAKEIESMGRTSVAIKANVTSQDEVTKMINESIEKLNNIDILVNNAGITRDGLLMRMKEEDWDSVITVNLKSAFLCSKSIVRHMMKQKQGRIINMASVIGITGNAGQANYAASKGGLISLTKSLAKEFAGRNILANAIAPGFIQTVMTDKLPDNEKEKILTAVPLSKMGQPEDIANAAIYLASDLSSYITGQVITVDGGLTM